MTMTTALLVLAVGVLLAVLVHGWWSVRRVSPRQPRPGLPGERVESALGAESQAAPAQASESADPQPGELPPSLPAVRPSACLDALIDALVVLTVEAPVPGELALAHLPASRRAGSKPMHVEGLEAGSGRWEVPLPGRTYTEFQAGVQLANRSGALNEIEYSEFVQKVQAFAEGVGAMADFPDMLEVVARARELDEFASPLDAQITLTLRARAVPWSVGYLVQCAARHGFVPGVLPGRLVVPAAEEGAPPVLVLAFDPQAALADDPQASALREVVLSLDVPQTPRASEPFPQWYQVGAALAAELEASPVDDAGRPVTLGDFDAIARQLEQLYRALESRDLAAGTPAARRLFSG